MTQPKGYIDTSSLDLIADLLASVKRSTYAALRIGPGDQVLDLGCGPATDTIALGLIVGETGQVAGVDYDLAMLEAAKERTATAGVDGWVSHLQADAVALPFAAGYFDACRSERLFQHLPDPMAALSEMVRVTKPGGRVVILDPDWGSLSIDMADTALERKFAHFHAESALHNGYSGRSLYRLFQRAGLKVIDEQIFPIVTHHSAVLTQSLQAETAWDRALAEGALTAEDRQRWFGQLARADQEGEFFASVNLIMVAGKLRQ